MQIWKSSYMFVFIKKIKFLILRILELIAREVSKVLEKKANF